MTILTVSGHQPTLFGSAGYWSKLACSDIHLVNAGGPYRAGDHLARLVTPDDGAVHVPLRRLGDRIVDLSVPMPPRRIMAALEQHYGRRRNLYRHRLAPILAALELPGEVDFVALAMRLIHATGEAAGVSTAHLRVVTKPSTGETTQARLMNRIRRDAPEATHYIGGPGARDYLRYPLRMPVQIHRMKDPSPLPFIHAIVTEAEPHRLLAEYTLEDLHEPVVGAVDRGAVPHRDPDDLAVLPREDADQREVGGP